MSIASVVQFEKMSAIDVLGLLGTLNAYAVELAVERASDEDIAGLRSAAEQAAEIVESAGVELVVAPAGRCDRNRSRSDRPAD